ncbi:MAG: hypothetical protein H7839_13650 [Magnetococcus sp. YQC-5]
METDWLAFGDRSSFALEYRFREDPDHGHAATLLESASWGEFRFWVQGSNLCQYHYQNQLYHETTWYLSCLFVWLAENWVPLFHEEKRPFSMGWPNARMGYLDALKRYLDDTDPIIESQSEALYDWWQRHAVRSCRQGGLFPDIFLHRLFDLVEISWGNFPLEGVGEDFYFTVPQGSASLPVTTVVDVVGRGLKQFVALLAPPMAHDQEWNVLSSQVNTILRQHHFSSRTFSHTSKIDWTESTSHQMA